MKTEIFNITIPENFTLTRDGNSFVSAENTIDKFDVQYSNFSLDLRKIEDIKTQKGDTILEQYSKWCEGFKPEITAKETQDINGFQTLIIKAKTDAVFQDEQYKITYFNACILLDEVWCLDFQFVFETNYTSTYGAIVTTVFQSITPLQTFKQWQIAKELDEASTVKSAYNEMIAEQDAEVEKERKQYEKWGFNLPKDGKECIQIGNFNFEFVENECRWNTVEFSKKFYVQIQAKTTEVAKAKDKGVLENGYDLDNGEVKLSFDCSEIYKNGIPTGTFTFKEGKTGAPQFIHFRNSGIPLDFYGKVTLIDGWVGINGILKKSYQEKPAFPVSIYKKLPTQQIDWSLYQFTLKEALQIHPETVQYLWIKFYDKTTFPKDVLTFKNLKTLSFQNNSNAYNAQALPLQNIDKNIDTLQHLTALTICKTQVEKLPESIGNLKHLERLNLNNNQLKSLPNSIFKLPKLEYLWASQNQISTIPQEIDMPELKGIELADNQLTTLPESLGKQPRLEGVKLERNPLEFLPEVFNTINLGLAIDDKRRLLNYDYQGADGKGMIAWDNAIYYAKNDSELHNIFLKAIKNTVLKKYEGGLEKLALKAVCIKTTIPDDYSTIGNTRFGGLPDLPKDENYPQWKNTYNEENNNYHHIFIAQLNCQELAPYQDYLPRTGMLYFFLEEEENFDCKIIYSPNTQNLESAKNINDSDLSIFDMDEPYAAFKAEFSNFVALPSFYNNKYWYKYAEAPELENLEDYQHQDNKDFTEIQQDDFRKALGKKGKQSTWNNTYFADSHHSINDYVFTQHESPQEQAALKDKGNPEDWVVLLKVNSDNNCGFSFWDAGELFFVIHKSDLAKGDFSKVFASIESS